AQQLDAAAARRAAARRDARQRLFPVDQVGALRLDRVRLRVEDDDLQRGRRQRRDHGADALAQLDRHRHGAGLVDQQGDVPFDAALRRDLGLGDRFEFLAQLALDVGRFDGLFGLEGADARAGLRLFQAGVDGGLQLRVVEGAALLERAQAVDQLLWA